MKSIESVAFVNNSNSLAKKHRLDQSKRHCLFHTRIRTAASLHMQRQHQCHRQRHNHQDLLCYPMDGGINKTQTVSAAFSFISKPSKGIRLDNPFPRIKADDSAG
jgi:hypothetical protein